jgi:hypothetical protein
VEGSDLFYDQSAGGGGSPPPPASYSRDADGVWAAGDRITWISGLILALSTFMGWYTGSGLGIQLAVIGWHTGVLGKLVFFIGLAVVAIVALRAAGFDLPLPESLVVLILGAVGTVFVLLRVLSVPDSVLPADSRGIGLWIALAAALGVIAGGLLRAAEDL